MSKSQSCGDRKTPMKNLSAAVERCEERRLPEVSERAHVPRDGLQTLPRAAPTACDTACTSRATRTAIGGRSKSCYGIVLQRECEQDGVLQSRRKAPHLAQVLLEGPLQVLGGILC